MTQRAATRLLATVGLSRRHATAVLDAGLAGTPTVTTSAVLYDAAMVEELVARRPIDESEIRARFPQGVFVARRPAVRLEELTDGWGIGLVMAAWLRIRIGQHGRIPLVATVAGYVTTGAEIAGVDTWVGEDPSRPLSTLALHPAGSWLDDFVGRRLPRGPGRPWSLVGFDPLPRRTTGEPVGE